MLAGQLNFCPVRVTDAMINDRFCCISIETATEQGSVAVSNGETVFPVALAREKGSSRQIYAAIREALDRAALDRSELTCVAFGNGPGSFTGVRVAAATAQSLAFSLGVPVIAVSSLAAIAVQAGRVHGAEPVAACLDARMGEAYLGVYRFDASGLAIPVQADRLVCPDDFVIEYDDVMAAGPGWQAYPQMIEHNAGSISATEVGIWPTAAAVAVEAQELFRQGKVLAPHEALPNYVRDKVAHQGK